jgi:hypothetical protein
MDQLSIMFKPKLYSIDNKLMQFIILMTPVYSRVRDIFLAVGLLGITPVEGMSTSITGKGSAESVFVD